MPADGLQNLLLLPLITLLVNVYVVALLLFEEMALFFSTALFFIS